MSALAVRRPAPGRLPTEAVAWGGVAILLGAALGVGAATGLKAVIFGVVLLPALAALLLQPSWLPALLMVTVFTEAVTVGGLTVSRLAGPLALVVLIVHVGARRGRAFPDHRVAWAAAAFCAWALASAMWTVNVNNGFGETGTLGSLSSLGLSGIYFIATATLVRTERDVRRLAVALFAMAVAMGTVAIAEYLGGVERAVGYSGDANYFASLQVVALPLAAVLASQARSSLSRAAYLSGLIVIVGSIFTSLSRGGILALVAVFALLLLQPARGFFRNRARKSAFVVATVVGSVALLAVSYNALAARTDSLFNSADGGSGRTNLWRAASTGFKAHPIVGMGFGAFEGQSNDLLRQTPGVDFSAYKLRPDGQVVHNVYLQVAVEVGLIGLALFLALLSATLATLRAAARSAIGSGQLFLSSVSRALVLSLLAFAFTSLFLSTETDRTLWMLMGLALALPRVVAAKERTVP